MQHGKAYITRQIAGRSHDLSKELDSIADRAFEVAKLARTLEEQHARPQADASVQCSLGGSEPVYQLDRSQRLKPFEFQPLTRRQLDGKTWQKIRAVNVDRMAGENDGRLLLDFYSEIADADLEADSGYNLTVANLIKLCQVCQLMMQWQQWQVEQGQHAVQVLTEEYASLQAGLSLIPKDIGLTDVDHGLVGLGKDFARVADTDMDLMFQKARAEERAGRQHVFAQQPPSLNSGTATSVAPPPSTVSLAAGQGASNMGGTSGCAVSSMGQGASSMGQGHAVNGIGQGASSMGSTSGHAGPSQGGTGWAGTAPAGTQPWQAPVQRRSSSSSLTGYVRNKQQQQQQQQQGHPAPPHLQQAPLVHIQQRPPHTVDPLQPQYAPAHPIPTALSSHQQWVPQPQAQQPQSLQQHAGAAGQHSSLQPSLAAPPSQVPATSHVAGVFRGPQGLGPAPPPLQHQPQQVVGESYSLGANIARLP